MKIALLALPVLAICGCAVAPSGVDPELACRDRSVTVNHAAAFLYAYPDHIEMCRGRTLTVRIRPSVPNNQARTRSGQAWLTKQSVNGSTIEVTVPGDAALEEYKYAVEVDGVGTLDPTIRVIR